MINVSMAGIDETIDIRQLELLVEGFPHLELAVLYSSNNSGRQLRYPSLNYIREVLDRLPNHRLALHLCGSIIDDICEQGEDFVYRDLFSNFKRIQFNTKVTTRLSPYIEQLKELYPTTNFIQPISSFSDIALHPSFDLLLDNSGGKGKVILDFPAPLDNTYCGYAGGIKLTNILGVKEKVKDFDKNKFWLDLESGIRDEKNKVNWRSMYDICSILRN